MLGAIYTSLSGLTAFSQGLEVISNNVANLNTPGFKLSDPLFRELIYQQQRSPGSRGPELRPAGSGVAIDSTAMSFRAGELRDTGNPLDAAIDGTGFFVLDLNGQQVFTRAGQFEFNADGILVERVTGAKVLVSSPTQAQGFFDLNSARVFEPRATSEVTLTGSLARASGSSATFELPNVTVFDAAGQSTVLRARLTRNANDPLLWTVEILKTDGSVAGQGAIAFNENGTPAEASSVVNVTIDPTSGEPFDVAFNFGTAGSFTGVTAPATNQTSQLQILRQNGLAVGSLTKTEFDDHGNLRLTYSNGETTTVATLVLAQFDSPEQLQSLGRSLFAANDLTRPLLGSALSSGLGRIVGAKIEMSNVELTSQFTDLIIMQRGYQASSQVSSIANEMIQQLLAMDRGR
jgi:flagellar hook protein FlgE